MKLLTSIFNLDFEFIDEAALKTKNLKKKHIYPSTNIFFKNVSIIDDVEKTYRKKLY